MFTYMDDRYCILEDTFITWSGTETILKVPTIYNGHRITKIGDGAFCKCNSLREIYIGEGFEAIGSNAFENCVNLEKVYIADTVKSIGAYAFKGCKKLRVIKFSDKLEKIDSYAFYDCDSLKELHIPSTIKTMADGRTQIFPDGSISNLYVDFKTSYNDFNEALKKTVLLSDGKRLFINEADQVEWLSVLKEFNLPNHIDNSMCSLFLVDQPKLDISPDMRRTVFSWSGLPAICKEDAAIRKQIYDKRSVYVNAEDERQWVSDRLREASILPQSYYNRNNELYFCVLDSFNVSDDRSTVAGTIKVYRSFGFYISVHRVKYNGNDYYIYSRNFLVGNKMARPDRISNKTPIYNRSDMAVYDENGLLSDRRLSEAIYAKYKLFSIL
ncbi:MAG: leucine-rich repeat domain-containing protein [Lachnospiraceae bacterium]|nr:leucine-rich repeat domain-containing protein [Lachnospiraceae bacterium]